MTAERKTEIAYEAASFAGRSATSQAFLNAVLKLIPDDQAGRLLDLGCGYGDVTLALAEARPLLEIAGLDISVPNIDHARVAAVRAGRKIEFVAADYLAWQTSPLDFIVADGVLQLIPADTKQLARKLAKDLNPGGFLVATVPRASPLNAVLVLQRRLWRHAPPIADKAAIALARLAHPAEASNILADRIGYLRIPPQRTLDRTFIDLMDAAGLRITSRYRWPGASVFKLQHELVTFQKAK